MDLMEMGDLVTNMIYSSLADEEEIPNIDNVERGIPKAANLFEAEMPLEDIPYNRQMIETMVKTVVEPKIREAWANAIDDGDLDDFVPNAKLSAKTEEHKEKQGFEANKPLKATGELIEQMRNGWPLTMEWKGSRLEARFGPGWNDDLDPSMKYHDMFFGNPRVGRGHKVSIPPRYLRINKDLAQSLEMAIGNFLRRTPGGTLGATDQHQSEPTFLDYLNTSTANFADATPNYDNMIADLIG